MPGIVGLISRMPPQAARQQLQTMVQRLRHEHFDDSGTWIDESLGLYIGWTSRQDSTHSPSVPLRQEHKGLTLVFSGEDFSSQSANGSSSSTVFCGSGPTFPASLNGWFHGVLIDDRARTAKLFNDRYGMHNLYYHRAPDTFYFAAEAKAILAVCPNLRAFDQRGLGEYIACGCVLENRTLFREIHLLPPASLWTFRNGALEAQGTYFSPEQWENQVALDEESFYGELRDIFSRNLPRYLNGGGRVAMSLTGGLDTRMIMAWQRQNAGSLPCYTFGGMKRDCQDVTLASRVADACGQPFEVIRIDQNFLRRFDAYAERAVYLSDGRVTVNRATDLFLNETARKIAPIRLTGNYGGEVLRRVRAFKPTIPNTAMYSTELQGSFREAECTYSTHVRCHPLSFAVFRQAPWHHSSLLGLEQTQVSLRSPYLDNEFIRTLFRAPQRACETPDLCWRLIRDGNAALARIRTDRGATANSNRVTSTISRKYLEFTFKAEYAYDQGMPQSVARIDHKLSRLHLERLFLGRHKFSHFRVWYRDALSSYVRSMLLDRTTLSRPYINARALQNIVASHTKGDRNYTSEIHMALTLELIQRLFFDSPN